MCHSDFSTRFPRARGERTQLRTCETGSDICEFIELYANCGPLRFVLRELHAIGTQFNLVVESSVRGMNDFGS